MLPVRTQSMQQPTQTLGDGESAIRCAIYTRYLSEQQRKTSTEDQIRTCRGVAAAKGWIVLDEFIRSDEELTGRTIVGREGLADLIRLAKQTPKPFDSILIDDTSRLGRYLPDVIRECDRLIFHGVFIYFVSDRLDTRDENARLVHMVKGYGDERFVREHGKKIHRGQEGRVLSGFISGGRRYGYRNAPIKDESRKGIYGQPAVIGVKQEIIPGEAKVVRRIMELRADGRSFGMIARTVRAEGIEPPRHPNKAGASNWYASTIKELTNNELYRGVRLWNRTQNVFNYAEGKKSKRKRPPSEWTRVEVPELRIVTDELWERVQKVNQRGRDKYYARRRGGMNRTATSRTYLFSGTMYCGLCGGAYTVVCGKAPNVRYGCPNYRFRDTCTNSVTILRTRLEEQLLAALSRNLMNPALEEDLVREFSAQLKARLEQEQLQANDAAARGSELTSERAELQRQAANLVDAIAKYGISPLLSSQLGTVEAKLADIDRQLAPKPLPKMQAFSDDEIRTFLRNECRNFCELLTSDPERARAEIQKRIKKLVLTPKKTLCGKQLEVTGDIALFVEDGAMLNNSIQRSLQHYIDVTGFNKDVDEPSPTIPLSGIQLCPAPPVVRFSAKALKVLRNMQMPAPSEFLVLAFPERL